METRNGKKDDGTQQEKISKERNIWKNLQEHFESLVLTYAGPPKGRAVALATVVRRAGCFCCCGLGAGEERLLAVGEAVAASGGRPARGLRLSDGDADGVVTSSRGGVAGGGDAVSGMEDGRLRSLAFPTSTSARAWERGRRRHGSLERGLMRMQHFCIALGLGILCQLI